MRRASLHMLLCQFAMALGLRLAADRRSDQARRA
ncbi:hypothetical protein T6L40_27050, partial [Pseudomonas aeruginosa]|nr:hypothetical protein [Pseudomonas aeruginosa]